MFWNIGWRAVFAGSLLAVTGMPAHAQGTVTAFTHVTVIPMDRERVLPDQTVLVKDGKITTVDNAAAVPIPAGAKQIDGRGKFLIPGLADMHAHLASVTKAVFLSSGSPFQMLGSGQQWADSDRVETEQWLYLYAAAGVTTVRVMGFFPGDDDILNFRARAAEGKLVSPRIYAAAGPVDNTQGSDDGRFVRFVEEAKTKGYDLVKLYGIDGPSLDSIAATAHRLGIPIAGHAPSYDSSPLALQRAMATGYASIEHLTGFDHYLGSDEDWWWEFWKDNSPPPQKIKQMVADSAKLRSIAVAMQQARVWNCPTLAMFDAGLLQAADSWPEMRYVTDSTRDGWRALQQRHERVRPTAEAALEVRRAIVKALHDAGAGLLLGTDVSVPFMVPGGAVHRELEAMVRAGLSPYDALATGTRNVAAYFGTLDSAGTVAVGRRADLVLLNGNPLDDIRQTMQQAGVMVNGRWLDRAELERGLAPLVGKVKM